MTELLNKYENQGKAAVLDDIRNNMDMGQLITELEDSIQFDVLHLDTESFVHSDKKELQLLNLLINELRYKACIEPNIKNESL